MERSAELRLGLLLLRRVSPEHGVRLSVAPPQSTAFEKMHDSTERSFWIVWPESGPSFSVRFEPSGACHRR